MATPGLSPESFATDEVLVEECLLGNEKAWSALIGKYTNLILSVPIRQGFSQDEAADVFQTVCLTLLRELSHLRQPRALPAWLMRLTAHTCIRWRTRRSRFGDAELDETKKGDARKSPDELALQSERRELLMEGLAELTPECRHLIDLLFFTDPPMRYDDAAAALGLATGSMGATRMRCLEKLRRSIEKKGFR